MNDIILDGIDEKTGRPVDVTISPCGCMVSTEHVAKNHVVIRSVECIIHKPIPCKNCPVPLVEGKDGKWYHIDVDVNRCDNPIPTNILNGDAE